MLTTRLFFLLPTFNSSQAILAQNCVSSENNHELRLNLTDLPVVGEAGISVNCINCYINGGFSMSAGLEESRPDFNFSGLPFDFSTPWAAAVVEDSTAHFELDFLIVAPPCGQLTEASQGLIPHLFRGISFDPIAGVSWTFNPMIYVSVNPSDPVNSAYGSEFTSPANSAIFIPLENVQNSSPVQTTGFNETSVTPLDYTSTDANGNFTFQLSFRPQFEIALDESSFDLASATIFTDAPKLDVTVNQVQNVTRDCQPAPPGTSPRLVFHNLTHRVPTLGYDVGFEADALEKSVAEEVSAIGDNETLPTSCLMYSLEARALVAVPFESKGGRIMATGQVAALWAIVFVCTLLM